MVIFLCIMRTRPKILKYLSEYFKRRLRIYEKPTSKTLAVIGLTASLLGMVSSV